MASFITTSITWGGKENLDYFLKPMFIGKSPLETQGVRVIPNVTSGQKLNYFGTVKKLLKKYAKGFNAVSGTTYTQRTLTTHRLKAEAADDALDFYQTVFESGLRKDDWNNLDETMLKQIIIELYRNAVASDVYRQFWLNDTNKEDVESGVFNGTADDDYNIYQGMWELLLANAATSPNDDQIFKHAISNAAVAQVDTLTITGSSGTANVTLMGKTYLVTFDTDLATTAQNFVDAHASDIAKRYVTVTKGSGATVVFTASRAGMPFGSPTIANATGDLAGSVANTTANTAPADLASGESEDTFLSLYTGADKVLKQSPKSEKVFLVTDTVLENYITYLEGLGTERSHIQLENGQEVYTYRGIPILSLGWDVHLDADFPHADGENPWGAHRVIYTHVDNLVLGIDSLNQFNETKMWYNPDEEENRFRSKLVMGCQYVHNKLTAIAI